jgi:hypothetical protein
MPCNLRMRRPFRSRISSVLVLLCFAAPAAMGAPITYVFSGPASGTLGATPFTGAQTTVTGTTDTANITTNGSDPCINLTGVVTINIAGVGSATTTGPNLMFSNHTTNVWGFENGTCASGLGDWLDVDDPAAGTYGLVTSIGPSTGTVDVRSGVATTAGTLQFSSPPLTFQATLGAGPPPPPASSTAIPTVSQWVLALLAFMLAGAGSLVLRKRDH